MLYEVITDGEWGVTYSCECGHRETADLRTAKGIKLGWRVDWPMRWKHENTVFEPAGEDHHSQGGSFDTARHVADEVYHWPAPVTFRYDFIGINRITSYNVCYTKLLRIPEIRSVLGGEDPAEAFAAKKRELESQASETARRLASINHYLARFGKERTVPYQVVLKELPGVFAFSLTTVVASYDEYFDLMPRSAEAILRVNPGLQCVTDPPYCFIRYLDGEYRERDISIEFCEAVTGPGNGRLPEGFVFKTVPAVPLAACVLHKGPYSDLPLAYAALFEWISDNGYETADCPRRNNFV